MDLGQGLDPGHRRALVDLVHGLADEAQFEHRTQAFLQRVRSGTASGLPVGSDDAGARTDLII